MELGSCSEDRLDQIIAGGELEIGRISCFRWLRSLKKRRRSHLGWISVVGGLDGGSGGCFAGLPGRSVGLRAVWKTLRRWPKQLAAGEISLIELPSWPVT